MTDDPDELRYEQAIARKDPMRVPDSLERIDWRLQYGIPELKLIGWIIVVLLALILWRVWK
jgi:hypothetical protein